MPKIEGALRAVVPVGRARPPPDGAAGRHGCNIATTARSSRARRIRRARMRCIRRTRFVSMVAAGVLLLGAGARAQIPLNLDVVNMSGYGFPLLGVIGEVALGNTANFELFADGQIDFAEVEALPTLGPIFNSRSCGGCHFQPALGGSGAFINEVRVRNNTRRRPAADLRERQHPARRATDPGRRDDLPERPRVVAARLSDHVSRTASQSAVPAGGGDAHDLRDDAADSATRPARPSPAGQNCTAERQSTPLFGFGFIEAVADATFDRDRQRPAGSPSAAR